mgnify:CR=1 FL=1
MKTKKIMLALAAVILCLAVIPFSACNDNKKTELQSMKEDMIQFVANYPSEFAYPQLMTMFYQDIIDETVEKINAVTSKEELIDIRSEFNRFTITNDMAYRSDNLSFTFCQDMFSDFDISGTYEDKPFYIHLDISRLFSAQISLGSKTAYYAEDPELVVKQMVITNNDVSGSEDFQPVARLGNSCSQYAFTKNTTHYAFIITKGKEVVGIHLQTMFLFFGPEENLNKTNKFLASGIFETPMTEDQVKNYIQTIIDGKTPSPDIKLIPNNASFNMEEMHLQFFVVAENDTQRFGYNINKETVDKYFKHLILSVYSDTAFTTDENGAPINQITLAEGDIGEIRADFPGDEYIIVTISLPADDTQAGETNRVIIFQMQPLDENIYSGRQMNLIAACDIKFRLPFIEKTEHDTTFALAVGKYLVNQLKSGVSPENLTIG